ncbi:hypothetical protein [Enterococcus avium]|uniref:hypothetical protein n=1 Tax=Enterococcus avium TaxID=33945 RepID=UPI00288D065F|nr:hypothetical protein [Enterococcus avium]MDT2483134.1 hypothetical protein [Enterococcus avium]MDT2509690.1 hypothetical protein [Enterococcus avium]
MTSKGHIDDLIELNGFIMSLTGVGILGLVGAGFRLIRKNYKEIKTRNKKLDQIITAQEVIQEKIIDLELQGAKRQQANVASLHDRIYSIYDEILVNRVPAYVTIDELSNLEYLWEAYSGLGGNGTGQEMYERILQLEIRKEVKK